MLARTASTTPRLTTITPKAVSAVGDSPSRGMASSVASTGASAPTIAHFAAPSSRIDMPYSSVENRPTPTPWTAVNISSSFTGAAASRDSTSPEPTRAASATTDG